MRENVWDTVRAGDKHNYTDSLLPLGEGTNQATISHKEALYK